MKFVKVAKKKINSEVKVDRNNKINKNENEHINNEISINDQNKINEDNKIYNDINENKKININEKINTNNKIKKKDSKDINMIDITTNKHINELKELKNIFGDLNINFDEKNLNVMFINDGEFAGIKIETKTNNINEENKINNQNKEDDEQINFINFIIDDEYLINEEDINEENDLFGPKELEKNI